MVCSLPSNGHSPFTPLETSNTDVSEYLICSMQYNMKFISPCKEVIFHKCRLYCNLFYVTFFHKQSVFTRGAGSQLMHSSFNSQQATYGMVEEQVKYMSDILFAVMMNLSCYNLHQKMYNVYYNLVFRPGNC